MPGRWGSGSRGSGEGLAEGWKPKESGEVMSDQKPIPVVGQKLWYVSSRGRWGSPPQQQEVIVAKVGRKWFTVEPAWLGRFAIDGWWADGGEYSSPGRLYESQAAYELECRRNRRWREFQQSVSSGFSLSRNLTAETILAAAKILGIVLEDAGAGEADEKAKGGA